MKKKLRLGTLPSGYNKYVSSLKSCLGYIEQEKPSKKQLGEWFLKGFHSGKRISQDYINTIRDLNLIAESGDTISLTSEGENFLRTGDNSILYRELDRKYEGIHDVMELLYEEPQSLEDISSSLRQTGFSWKKKTQLQIRLNWLHSLGYVEYGPIFSITLEGTKTFDAEIKEEEAPSHDELQKQLVEFGKSLSVNCFKEYPINGEKIDAAWIQKGAKNPFAVFEIQLRGNLKQALANLAHARTTWNSRPFLITTKKQKLIAKSFVNKSFPDLTDDLKVYDWSEMDEIKRGAGGFTKSMEKLGFRPKLRFRRPRSQIGSHQAGQS
jgi:hypothetical protein